ncbi:MAG: hypothetical protein AAF514_07560, partial [Verrucomicrobiota bacterium]
VTMAKAFGNELWFVIGGRSLWKSDGTAEGTIEILLPGLEGSIYALGELDSSTIAVFGGAREIGIFRVQIDGSGFTSFDPGSYARDPVWFEHAFWWLDGPYNNQVLWRSDGTEHGTGQIDLETTLPGNLSLADGWLSATEERLYFALTHPTSGHEVWALDRSQFDRWRDKHVPAGMRVIPNELDSDGDGVSDFVEYAFATDPVRKTILPPLQPEIGETDETLTLAFPMVAMNRGLELSIQESADLREWEETVRFDEMGVGFPGKEPLSDLSRDGRREVTLLRPADRRAGYYRLRFFVK